MDISRGRRWCASPPELGHYGTRAGLHVLLLPLVLVFHSSTMKRTWIESRRARRSSRSRPKHAGMTRRGSLVAPSREGIVHRPHAWCLDNPPQRAQCDSRLPIRLIAPLQNPCLANSRGLLFSVPVGSSRPLARLQHARPGASASNPVVLVTMVSYLPTLACNFTQTSQLRRCPSVGFAALSHN